MNWRAASPWRQLNLPQIRLEPLLKARAEELSPGRIRFGHELIDLEQDDDGVRARIRDNASGREYVVRSEYLLGADGGRRVAGLIGVDYEGLGVVTQTATLHVSADFSRLAKDPDVLIRWIFSPQAGVLVVMVPMGPERWGPGSEEWVIHLNYPVDDPRAQSDAQIEADARKALGIGDLPMQIHKVTRWSVEAVMASAFRVGRVFLLGDAAHRHPPTGGLGLTSAIHDAQNLCWKLAAVLAGYASPALLDTYEAERRPVDQRNCQRSLENAINHFAIGAALGISPENTPRSRTWSCCAGCGAAGPRTPRTARACCGRCARSRWSSTSSTSNTATLRLGSRRARRQRGRRRRSTTSACTSRRRAPAPRCRTPGSTTRTATAARSRTSSGRGGSCSSPARTARRGARPPGELAEEAGIPLDAVRIGHLDGDLYDPRCAWLRHRQIASDGAVLVRPDRFVAWRSANGRRRPPGRTRQRAQPDPRPAGRRASRIGPLTPPFRRPHHGRSRRERRPAARGRWMPAMEMRIGLVSGIVRRIVIDIDNQY